MGYYKYINSKGIETGYGDCIAIADEYGSADIQNIEVTYEEYKLYKLKQDKILLNDELRDKALFGGVEYQGVLFDSDTDQKVNLAETVRDMSDMDTIVWYGMNNQGLLCTKADLLAIGEEIRNLTKFCWGMNAYYKDLINQADNIAALEKIVINYEADE